MCFCLFRRIMKIWNKTGTARAVSVPAGGKSTSLFFICFLGFFRKMGGVTVQYETRQKGGAAVGANTEAEMLEDMAKRFCPNCGVAVVQNGKGRPRIFCSEPCRYAWKNRNPRPENWKSTRTAICPECGKPFLASREYGRVRKYCSHACANRGRAKRKECEGNGG